MKVTRSAAVYFAIQGAGVFAWWGTLYLYPSTRKYFALEQHSETSLLAFWMADMAFIGVGSLAAAWLCATDNEFNNIASWFVTGCVSYAAVYTFAFALMTDNGWLGVVMMFPAMIWSGVFSVGISFTKTMFRPADDSSAKWIIFKTFAQIVIVWSMILAVFPYLITIVEDKIGIPRLAFPFQKPLAILLFVLISSLGVYSAYVMSRIGKGTPLPLDHAKNLVIAGPYRYVRNPMAVSGIGQGLAVALFLGSPLVALYALMGSAIWQLIFRPLEEDDLAARFGKSFEEYRGKVKCWIPRVRPYQIEGTLASLNSTDSPFGRM
ncbi:MAG: isoprenylcysteine carboxylmethyltransferase family protein [Acidobacteria bacterium]|nr:isoprenylcysteine carboxylmethyltransferase family protein [Acidobacteriota bacterium]